MMNPFYTWPIYFTVLTKWIDHFEPDSLVQWPIPRKKQKDGLFQRLYIHSATELEMLDFYGCLDAMK